MLQVQQTTAQQTYSVAAKLPISKWAEDDQPRTKLMIKGKAVLSDAELLSILIGCGTPDENAVELSKRLLHSAGHNLNELARLSVHDLMKFKGIGEAKAITIVTAIELGRRRQAQEPGKRAQIVTSKDAVEILQPLIGDLQHEEFWMLFLNRTNQVTGKQQVSSGGMSGTVVDPKIIFRAALDNKAVGLILSHNHPSGNVKPSQQDIDLTKKVVSGGKLLEISVLDHVIISQSSFFSFAEEGMM